MKLGMEIVGVIEVVVTYGLGLALGVLWIDIR